MRDVGKMLMGVQLSVNLAKSRENRGAGSDYEK
jgi:hypothetical protein